MPQQPSHPTDEPATYRIAHIEQAIATDERTTALHLHASIAGNRVFVTGTVPTPTCHDAVTDVVREVAPDLEVCNETVVRRLTEPESAERLT